jgi:hypothetical protein
MTQGIEIGRVVRGGKVHLHLDGHGCGAARKSRIIEHISDVTTLTPDQCCKRCFTERRMREASRRNVVSESRWSWTLDWFLSTILPPQPTMSEGRLAEMIAGINANFDRMGI